MFSSQLPFLSKTLPLPLSPTASHWQPNIECGKQEKQQHCNITSFGRERCFGYISLLMSSIALELPDPAAGGPACLCSKRMLCHQLLVSLASRIPHENELLQGQGDWAIHVSLSENLGLSSSLENTFCPHSSIVITCSPSLLWEFE